MKARENGDQNALIYRMGRVGAIETGGRQKVCMCVPKADKCSVAHGEIDAMRYKALVGAGMEIICAGEKQKKRKKADACGQKTILQWTKR